MLGLHLKLTLVLEIETIVIFLFVGLGFSGNLLVVEMVKLLLILGALPNDKKNKMFCCYDFFSGLC